MGPSLVEGERLRAGCLVGDICGDSPFFGGSLRAISAYTMGENKFLLTFYTCDVGLKTEGTCQTSTSVSWQYGCLHCS